MARASELVEAAKQGPRDASALSTWNDINIALGNALAVDSLMSNVHPDEAVRNPYYGKSMLACGWKVDKVEG